MRCKWYFRDEPSPNFSEILVFWPKSSRKPPPGHPCVELFLSKLESELFSFWLVKPQAYNRTKEEWLAMWSLVEDQSIIIKPADKGSYVVIWNFVRHLLMLKSRITMINYCHNLQKRVTSFLNGYIITS